MGMAKKHDIGWFHRIGPSILFAALAFTICLLLLFGLFRNELEPDFGSKYPLAFQFETEPWHWISALAGLWAAISLSVGRLIAAPHGLFLSGLLAMFIGFGIWILLGFNVIDVTQPYARYSAVLAFWSGWLIVQIARLPFAWTGQRVTSRLKGNDKEQKQDLQEHFYYLFASLVGLAVIAALQIWPDGALALRQAQWDSSAMPALVALLVITSFFPLVIGFWKEASPSDKKRDSKLLRTDVVTGQWAATFIASICGVWYLAISAARHASTEISARVAFLTYVCVVILFLLVIVVPHLWSAWQRHDEKSVSGEPKDRETVDAYQRPATGGVPLSMNPRSWLLVIGRFFDFIAKGFSVLDSLLVKILAPASGGTRPHWSHLHVIAIMGLLSILGLAIPKPFGLAPLGLGIILIFALGRRWAWVEGDRETASRLERTEGSVIHLGFDNDLKDEALTGYAWLFFLVPLTLYQLQDLTGFQPVLNQQSDNIILVWIQFFGGELAKAVPFVDWWDIYGKQDVSSIGKHLTFISRAAVDLVILTALFQALGIWQRNRVQSVLYRDGHLEAFDPFKEQEFFERGMMRLWGALPNNDMDSATRAEAEQFEQRIKTLKDDKRLYVKRNGNVPIHYEVRESFKKQIDNHVEARSKVLAKSSSEYDTVLPYSRQRLGELITGAHGEDLKAGAQWMIGHWDVLIGSPLEQLNQIAQRWVRESSSSVSQKTERVEIRDSRNQKLEFERILVGLAQNQWTSKITKKEVGDLMQCLHKVKDNVEFDFSRILAFELFGKLQTQYAVLFLSQFVLHKKDMEANDAWRQRIISTADGAIDDHYIGRMDMRERVYRAARDIGCNPSAVDTVRWMALELLEWMSTADRAESTHARTAILAKETRDKIENDDRLEKK